MSIQNIPAEQQPFKYMYSLQLSNNATTPNTVINVSGGQCRDVNDVVDMVYPTATTINCAVNGINALDTGSLAANTFYKIFAVSDSSNYNVAGFMATLQTNTVPVMPLGYDSYRLIGYILTNGSSNILPFYMATSAGGNLRYMQYDAPITVTVTGSGTSTSYLALDLSVAVPLANFEKVRLYSKWTPNAATNTLSFQPTGGVGNFMINTAVSTAAQDVSFDILPLIASAKPEVSYKVSAGTLTAVTVMGYNFLV